MQAACKKVLFLFERAQKEVARYPLISSSLGFAFGLLVGSLRGADWRIVLCIIAAVLIFASLAYLIVRPGRILPDDAARRRDVLFDPDPYAQARMKQANFNGIVIDRYIELTPHPSLHAGGNSFLLPGWAPSEIRVIIDDTVPFAKDIFAEQGIELKAVEGNYTKFHLLRKPFTGIDVPDLRIEVKRIAHQARFLAREFIRERDDVAAKIIFDTYGHVLPEENMIPGSLCLHFTVRTKDGYILVLKNAEKENHSRLYSITVEEQLDCKDFPYGGEHAGRYEVGREVNPIERLFYRAMGEEIFYCTSTDHIERKKELEANIDAFTIISLGIEMPGHEASFVGIVQLSLSLEQLRQSLLEGAKKQTGTVHDDEGELYALNEAEGFSLLKDKKAKIHALFTEKIEEITKKDLHPSSMYRLYYALSLFGSKKIYAYIHNN